MPIYEYECAECGHQLEKIQKMGDAPLVDCPSCEKPALTKLISAAGFRLSGKGWYETDFKTGNQKNLAKKEKEPPPCADSKSSSCAACATE
ncbi:MAG: hypothetical protein Kow006_01590 [Gammaproteobacteria bacterium]